MVTATNPSESTSVPSDIADLQVKISNFKDEIRDITDLVFGFSIYELTMIILSIGSGSMMISHVNDSYFWIVTKQTNLNLSKGLKYFSLMSIIQSIGTFLFILFLISLSMF